MADYALQMRNSLFRVTTGCNLRPETRETIRLGLNFPFHDGT